MMTVLYFFILTIITVTANVSHYTDFWKGKATVDWREYRNSAGYPIMREPQDQGGCGTCYGFAITGVLESHAAIALNKKIVPLSPQYFVDCFDGDGCAGGSLSSNLGQLEMRQFIPYLKDYPYESKYEPEKCAAADFGVNPKKRNGMAGYYLVVHSRLSNDIKQIEDAIRRGPTIHGMFISTDALQWGAKETSSEEGIIDKECGNTTLMHAWGFVGFTDQYFIIRNSYGKGWANHGYVNYNKVGNIPCNFAYRAFSLVVIKRREIEYKLGVGLKNFYDANAACKSYNTPEKSGWTLAVIPTRMHRDEVYRLVAAKYTDEKKSDEKYNYVWIGINTALNEDSMTFVDGTPAYYRDIKLGKNPITSNFLKMSKFAGSYGRWVREYKAKTYRFVCSRYRAEECERKVWSDIGEDAMVVKYSTADNEIVEGTVMSVECMDGFSPSGTAECRNGKWSKDIKCILDIEPTTPWIPVTTPCSEFDTSSLNIKQSTVNYSADKVDGKYASGTTAVVTIKRCSKGYRKKIGTVVSTCSDGTWSAVAGEPCMAKKRRKAVMV